MADAGIKLIVGLGNPGAEYAKTRHNVGAWFVQRLAEREHVSLKVETKLHGSAVKFVWQTHACWLFIPTTYMNESGRAVAAIAQFYKIPAEQILVVHDELDFPAGTIRIKQDGGHGGHNGLRDIIRCLGSKAFYRLRVGIGHPGDRSRVTSYVLNKPTKTEYEQIMHAIDEGLGVVDNLMAGDFQRAFHWLHSD